MEGLALLNHVANQPEVLPFICPGHDRVSLDKFFDQPRNVMLGDERGLVLFEYLRPGAFEIHLLFTNALRGRDAIAASRTAINAMFTCYSASIIFGFVPRQNRACRAIRCALGFRSFGTIDHDGQPFAVYALRREDHEFHYGLDRRERTANR